MSSHAASQKWDHLGIYFPGSRDQPRTITRDQPRTITISNSRQSPHDNHHLCSARKSSIFHALQGWSSLLMLTRRLPYSLYILWGGPFILHIFLRALTPFHEALELTSFALSHISLQGPDSLIKFPCPQSTSSLEALIPSWLLDLNSLLEVPLPSRPDSLFELPLPSRSWFPPWSPLVLEVLTLSPQSPNSLLEANVAQLTHIISSRCLTTISLSW